MNGVAWKVKYKEQAQGQTRTRRLVLKVERPRDEEEDEVNDGNENINDNENNNSNENIDYNDEVDGRIPYTFNPFAHHLVNERNALKVRYDYLVLGQLLLDSSSHDHR